MKKVIHKADTRGHSKYEWLDSYHTFSFDEYFDSNRINFGALRVLNDDKVAPGERLKESNGQFACYCGGRYCRRQSHDECGSW